MGFADFFFNVNTACTQWRMIYNNTRANDLYNLQDICFVNGDIKRNQEILIILRIILNKGIS